MSDNQEPSSIASSSNPAPPQEQVADGSIKAAAPPPWAAAQTDNGKDAKDQSMSVGKARESIFKKLIPVLGLIILVAGGYFLVKKIILPYLQKEGSPISSSKKITLTYWGLWEPETVVASLIEEYQKKNPNVTIKYVHQSYKDYRERLQSTLARGEEVDIFRFHQTWLPMLIKDLAPVPQQTGQNLNLDGNYFPVVGKSLKAEGSFYGIPLEYDGLALYYNTKIFKDAGKTPPTTWEELRRTALDLTVRDKQGKIQIAGAALGTTNNVDHFSDILALMMLQNGADLAKPEGALAEDALKFYTIFVTSDKVWDEDLPSSTYAFANEKTAMYFGPSWRAHDIKNINPNLEFKTIPVPQLPETKVGWASFWAEGVAAKSKNIEEAFKFLEYLSEKESLIKLYSSASQIRTFGEPYPKKDMVSELEEDPIVGAFVKQGEYAQSWYLCSFTHDNGINDKMIKYYQDAINEVLGHQNVTTALKTTAQGVTQVLNQYGIK
ncbi:hypothetical protein A3J78_02385 [Candidatus Beckwithbacteria bacterium RBG_13_35_6]|uniref:ABC transporter substrate-binding protein n=1 Tax=Candidatus Beckwithbacteria bacterium RBG_13_35_6 TaxID=1797456 RepID=A0A1F5DEK8_9BACT|nr:MAG: hypothetical protein A3J78_02385 [Candidatus Beckwithbacteria bacterium RBG_13_35_6]